MENSTKKTIIVIGKMGHGKSTFVKMLVNDQDKNKIQVGGGEKSVTSKCTLYKVDTPNLKMNEQLYILDTPGLDSEDSIILVLEQLDNCIVQNKCEILGLAYVLDIAVIRQKKDDDKLFIFFKHFKLRHSIKKQIFFCVLSKFDKYYEDGEENQEKMVIFQKHFADNGLGSSWDRKIKWMSHPAKSSQRFLKITNPKNKHEAYPIYKNQWISLKNNITNIITTKKYLPFNQYDSDLEGFNQLMIKQLQSIIINSKQTVLQQIPYQTNLIQKQISNQKQINTAKKISLGAVGVCVAQVAAITALEMIGTGVILTMGTTAVALAAPLVGIAASTYGLFKIFQKKYLYQKGSISMQIQKNLWLKARMRSYQLKKLEEGIILEQDKIIIKKSPWFSKIKSASIQNSKKGKNTLKFIELNQLFEEKIAPGNLMINFQVRTPTINEYQKFLLKVSQSYYKKR